MQYFAFVDMDGVLVDFLRGALSAHNRLDALDNYPRGQWLVERHLGMTAEEFWGPLQGFEFWDNLPAYHTFWTFVDVINETFGGNWAIASTPCDDPFSAAGKLSWLSRYLPKCNGRSFRRFFLCEHKYRLAKPGTVLIDDNETNCRDFVAAGGRSVLIPRPWNTAPIPQNLCAWFAVQLDPYREANKSC